MRWHYWRTGELCVSSVLELAPGKLVVLLLHHESHECPLRSRRSGKLLNVLSLQTAGRVIRMTIHCPYLVTMLEWNISVNLLRGAYSDVSF